jgi:hypothetical protein
MADCEHLKWCPIFASFTTKGAKDFWQGLYCKSPRQVECARRMLMKAGKEVPDTLMPNGKFLDPLDTVILH